MYIDEVFRGIQVSWVLLYDYVLEFFNVSSGRKPSPTKGLTTASARAAVSKAKKLTQT